MDARELASITTPVDYEPAKQLHDYAGVDMEIIWRVVSESLPLLTVEMATIRME